MRLRLWKSARPRRQLAVPRRATDVETALLRYLMFGVLPAWFVPAVLDWIRHRRTDIEHTAGTKESLIHLLMMAEVGAPILLVLFFEVNPLVLAVVAAAIAAHEATALWDVRTAEGSGRAVTPWEQHIHSFLESLPIMSASALGCLHWQQVRELLQGSRDRDAWRLTWKQNPLPTAYLAGIGAAITGAIALPYGEELLRCLAAEQGGRRRSAPQAATA